MMGANLTDTPLSRRGQGNIGNTINIRARGLVRASTDLSPRDSIGICLWILVSYLLQCACRGLRVIEIVLRRGLQSAINLRCGKHVLDIVDDVVLAAQLVDLRCAKFLELPVGDGNNCGVVAVCF